MRISLLASLRSYQSRYCEIERWRGLNLSYYYLSSTKREKMDVATAEGVEIEGIKSFVTLDYYGLIH